jgi:DNA-binding SARP family transcriptional activator
MDEISASGGGSSSVPNWALRLFGRFDLSTYQSGERVTLSGRRERVLLAYLALSSGGRASRRKLTALLWGESSDETSLDNLRVCVWALRKALGDSQHRIIASDGDDIVLDLKQFEADVLEFRRLAGASEISELYAAANLYAGEFLEGFEIESEEFESWRREQATRYKDLAIDVLGRLMMLLAVSGETARAIEAGLQVLRLDSLHEAAVRRLMQLYAETGRRGAATELYRSFAERLRSELNAQPEAETRALFADLARGVPKDASPASSVSDQPGRATMTPATDAATKAAIHLLPR